MAGYVKDYYDTMYVTFLHASTLSRQPAVVVYAGRLGAAVGHRHHQRRLRHVLRRHVWRREVSQVADVHVRVRLHVRTLHAANQGVSLAAQVELRVKLERANMVSVRLMLQFPNERLGIPSHLPWTGYEVLTSWWIFLMSSSKSSLATGLLAGRILLPALQEGRDGRRNRNRPGRTGNGVARTR